MGINDILSKLNEINHEDVIKIFIPSLQREVSFKPLSLHQQKDILKAGISSDIFNILEFNAIFNNIIEQNSLERNQYKVQDRLVIAIAFRNKFTSQPLDLDDKKIDIESLRDKKINFETDAFSDFLIEEGILKIKAAAPALSLDQTITKLQLSKIKKTENIDIGAFISEMYVFEILKYIKSIHIGDLDQDLSILSIEDRVKVVEQLPASLITQLNNYISNKFKTPEDEYLTVDGTKLTIDARLFV
jgi:hypothetical protein